MNSIVQQVFSFLASNSFASGILIGVMGSIVYAFLVARIRPTVKFKKYISKRRARHDETISGNKYLFQFWNGGWRDIVDLELSARLVVRGMDRNYPRNFTYFTIPLGYTTLPRVERWPITERIFELLTTLRLMKKSKKLREEPLRHLTRFDIHAIQELQEANYSSFLYRKLQENQTIKQELIRDNIDATNLRTDPQFLEHLLQLGAGSKVSYVEINITGYDSLSGTKRLFTKQYQYKDILSKDFYGNDLKIQGNTVNVGTLRNGREYRHSKAQSNHEHVSKALKCFRGCFKNK